MNSRHTFDPPPPGCFCLAVNMISKGRFLHAGVPMPLSELETIPPNLRKPEFIIRHDPRLDPGPDDSPRSLTFRLNTPYALDEDGNRRQARHFQREAAQLEAIADQEAGIAEELQNANDDLDPVIAEQIQDAHDSLVQRQIAERQAAARQREMDEQAAREFIAEQDALVVDDSVAPAIREEPIAAPKPRKMRVRFVCRNGTWLRAKKMKNLKIGEPVFVRTGRNNFENIGQVDELGHLPACYLEEIEK